MASIQSLLHVLPAYQSADKYECIWRMAAAAAAAMNKLHTAAATILTGLALPARQTQTQTLLARCSLSSS
jgi:hypothetical protein